MDTQKLKSTALNGITSNPTFVLILGMCPTIAKTDTLFNAFGLSVVTALVLILSNIIISSVRKVVPDNVHIPVYIMIIATLVTVAQLLLQNYFSELYSSVGTFIPLIVVNCIILGRAEAFAGKNGILLSAVDGASIGLGFIASLCLLGALRQGLTYLGLGVFGSTAGGFISLAILIALYNFVYQKVKTAVKNNVQKTNKEAV